MAIAAASSSSLAPDSHSSVTFRQVEQAAHRHRHFSTEHSVAGKWAFQPELSTVQHLSGTCTIRGFVSTTGQLCGTAARRTGQLPSIWTPKQPCSRRCSNFHTWSGRCRRAWKRSAASTQAAEAAARCASLAGSAAPAGCGASCPFPRISSLASLTTLQEKIHEPERHPTAVLEVSQLASQARVPPPASAPLPRSSPCHDQEQKHPVPVVGTIITRQAGHVVTGD